MTVTLIESSSTYPFEIGFSCLAWFPPGSSKLFHESIVGSFLLPSKIPWYGCNTGFFLPIQPLEEQFLAIMNKAVMNIHLQFLKNLQFLEWKISLSFSYDKSPRVRLLSCTANPRFQFWKEPPNYFSEWLYHFATSPPPMSERSIFSTSLPASGVVTIFHLSHSDRWEMISHCSFFLYLYWSIIALQCCVIFCWTTKRISYMYTYIPISPPSWASLPLSLSHPSRLSQSIKMISLCYAAVSH